MRPALSVLQLDTSFPRVAGDVASPATFLVDVEAQIIPQATVGRIVSDKPEQIDISPFVAAAEAAKGNLVVTSCGFLSTWQDHIDQKIQQPFISSALIALDRLSLTHEPDEVMILTYDASKLTAQHLGENKDFAQGIIGLPSTSHLRDVIGNDLPDLEMQRAASEVADLVAHHWRSRHKQLLLECTNLPPYKSAIRKQLDIPITDILTLIEAAQPQTVHPDFL